MNIKIIYIFILLIINKTISTNNNTLNHTKFNNIFIDKFIYTKPEIYFLFNI